MTTRQFLTTQALTNAAFLNPETNPTLLTAKGPDSSQSRILIVATVPNAPQKILFEQQGTTDADFESLLSQTEASVHQRLDDAPSQNTETLRTAVDAARLQRENTALLERLERARTPMKLDMPTERRKSLILENTPPAENSETRKPTLLAPIAIARPATTTPSPPRSASPPLDSRPAGLPKSKRFMATAVPISNTTASTTSSSAFPTGTSSSISSARQPADDHFDTFDLVSPRTIPNAAAPSSPNSTRRFTLPTPWGEGMGKEADDVAAWIQEVSGALTPPLTPPMANKVSLPKSRKFEQR